MIQQQILDSDTKLEGVRIELDKFTSFTEIEQKYRKKFPEETKDKSMIRCFECCSGEITTYWRK